MRDPSGEGELAGIMDASGFLPEGTPSFWSVYWETADIDDTVAVASHRFPPAARRRKCPAEMPRSSAKR
jgi:hypothetical protein